MAVTQRTMSLDGLIKRRYVDDRITWDEMWVGLCDLVGVRSQCSRDRIGAVIVTSTNEVVSLGYNGPPSGTAPASMCIDWCLRAQKGARGDELDSGYGDCPALHSEANAILRAAPRPTLGTILYVSSSICQRCALLVIGAGIARVIMKIQPQHQHRNPSGVVKLLMDAGVEVVVWGQYPTMHRAIFIKKHGLGPHPCYFCNNTLVTLEAVHHIDGDHANNAEENLAAAHLHCHSIHHQQTRKDRLFDPPKYRTGNPYTRRKPLLRCATCGVEKTPGWLARHVMMYGHDDGGALEAWRERL